MTTASINLTEQQSALLLLPMFESLKENEIKQLAGLLTEVSYKAGETIFYEKEPGDAMYILRAGSVRIWVHDEDVKEVTLAELQPGAFFGELAVLDGSERSATAEAIKDSTLYRLSREDFHAFLLNHPPVALNMIREMGVRLRQTNQLVSQRVTRNINREMEQKMTLGQRIADRIAAFGGSWPFIIIFGSFLATWILLNTFIALNRTGSPSDPNGSFDVYPFIALNLVLSMISAFQAPIIMMSQNRSGEKDRLAAENDYKVNLKSELMLEELTRRMERLQNEQMEELLSTTRLTKVIEQHLAESQEQQKAGGVK
ncbi:MAG TPA: DUF1003 domain-containing protein [Pyrinomonadaceae bacterium]|nr:DUF1003 domain-containing protein [Pyrinomonadaceae bacterium]